MEERKRKGQLAKDEGGRKKRSCVGEKERESASDEEAEVEGEQSTETLTAKTDGAEDGRGREVSVGIQGMRFIKEFFSGAEQGFILEEIDKNSWLSDLKRRVQHYGYKYDYKCVPSFFLLMR